MKYIFGPVPSRRLGRSLGIDLIPLKTCNYQCIYCQLGRTKFFTNERKSFFPKDEIISEMEETIKQNEKNIDYITFVGSGEPTLCKDLDCLILKAKEISKKPICVITNGGLLYDKKVQDTLMLADVVLPSLDAWDKKSFIKINRPHPSIKFDSMIQGFINFKRNFKGQFWIELMLMKGINDSKENLFKINEILDLIQPDKIDINVPIRPPTESWVKVPDETIISVLNEIFNGYNNINFPEIGKFSFYSSDFEKELLSIIQRHPMREDQIIETFASANLSKNDIVLKLKRFELEKKIKNWNYNGKSYWKLNLN